MHSKETMITALRERFGEAGVPLRIAPQPFIRGQRVQIDRGAMVMDIRTVPSAPPGEAVMLWPGEARLAVVGIDRRLQQLVLDVEEQERRILVRMAFGGRPVSWREHRVPADRRSFLIGMDQAHLFMARLPRLGSSVANAHASLAPDAVRALRRAGAAVVRQGEHFFIPATHAELQAIAECLRRWGTPRPGVVRAQRNGQVVWRQGKPHVATETLMVDGVQFVRGVIRHPDHHPLRLREWARPELNSEVQAIPLRGVRWVD